MLKTIAITILMIGEVIMLFEGFMAFTDSNPFNAIYFMLVAIFLEMYLLRIYKIKE